MLEVSRQQIIDASGNFEQGAVSSGVSFERSQKRLAYPAYGEAILALGIETVAPAITLDRQQLNEQQRKLRKLGGLRVMAGVKTRRGTAYLPGVILPDGSDRIGVLKSPNDRRDSSLTDAMAMMNDLQQLILAKIAAEHQPDTGRHGVANSVNGAEIGHAALVAATADPRNIHSNVHNFVNSGTLSETIAKSGATDIQTSRGIRRNEETVLSLSQLSNLVIVGAHQTPWPFDGDPFDVSAGFTYSAVQTQTERPKPNIAANLENLMVRAS